MPHEVPQYSEQKFQRVATWIVTLFLDKLIHIYKAFIRSPLLYGSEAHTIRAGHILRDYKKKCV
jgi:hypothetical protein